MKSATRATTLAAAIFGLLSFVSAHGSLSGIESNGQSFTGPIPGSGADENSPIRAISTLEPITDPKSAAMACGPGAAASAGAVAEVTAGGSMKFRWRSGESNIPWPHRWGPCMLYAYQCPEGVDAKDCAPPTGAEWILIDAQGFDPNAASIPGSIGWVQDRFHFNQSVTSPIPAGLPNGNYLFRHELIALHKGSQVGGAEYYTSCTQVRVTGGSNGRATQIGADLAALPGVYDVNDPGLHVNVFDSNLNGDNYKMPGPKLFTGSGNSGNGGSGGAQNNGSAPPSAGDDGQDEGTPVAPAPAPSQTGTCKRKNKKRSLRKTKKRALHKRHLARAAAAAEGIALRGTPKRIVDLQY